MSINLTDFFLKSKTNKELKEKILDKNMEMFTYSNTLYSFLVYQIINTF